VPVGGIVRRFPNGQFLARLSAVRDDHAGGDIAAIADHRGVAAGVLGAGFAEGLAVVAVAWQRGAERDD
jgi:hypothetical protein